jgi:site-specific recombinase XerD
MNPTLRATPIKALDRKQEADLLAHTQRRYPHRHMIYLLALRTGARLNEILQLKYNDIEYSGITTRQLEIRPEIAKRAHSRLIPLTEETRWYLEKYITEVRPKPAPSAEEENFFLHPHHRTPINPRTLQRWITTDSAAALGQAITFHTLRHTFATRIREKVDLPTLQLLLGHHHLSSTQVYCHPSPDDLRHAINAAYATP